MRPTTAAAATGVWKYVSMESKPLTSMNPSSQHIARRLLVALIAVVALWGAGTAGAQEAIVPAAGELNGARHHISFTIGQTADATVIDTALTVSRRTATVSEGVQQTYLSSEQLDIPSVTALSVHIDVYPNPTIAELNIRICEASAPLNYTLFDNSGRTMATGRIEEHATLDMSRMAAGAYLLQVSSADEGQQNTYRIIKGH